MIKLYLFLLAAGTTSLYAYADDRSQLSVETRSAIKALAAELKGTLQSAMKTDGPVKAISVCNEKAPKLAQKVSHDKGMEVGRTSLKVRNPLNAPDAWELSVLEQFEQRKARGEDVNKIEYSETTQHNGSTVFRYMKAIPTDDVCLLCHGDQIAGNLSAELKQLYPNDKATGFRKGDIRGAFTVVKILE